MIFLSFLSFGWGWYIEHLWAVFVFLFFYRFTRHYINLYAFWKLKPIPIPDNPSYTSKDVTAIIPTINGDGHDLRQTIRTVLLNDPSEIVISTIDASHERAKKMVAAIGCKKIKIVTVPQANKRRQLCRAIPEVTTRITLLVDDDVIWPETLLPWILAPFENSKVGGVGTCQRLLREETTNMWNFLGAIYLERRNFDCGSCTFMDGGLPCLSGRTVAYRTHILQDSEFTYGFTHETWRGCLLNADDDNFITRWMVNKGWNTYIQYHRECEVLTTLESGSRYLRQCQRWARSNWRSNLRSMLLEGNIWIRHPWSSYAVFQTTLTAGAIYDLFMFFSLGLASADSEWSPYWALIMTGLAVFWVFTKISKVSGHYLRYPSDICYVPLQIAFGIFHTFCIKIPAFCTMNETTWGSREGADTDNAYRLQRLPPRTNDARHLSEK